MKKRKVFIFNILVSIITLNMFVPNINALVSYNNQTLQNNKESMYNEEVEIAGLDNVEIKDFNCSLKLNEIISKIDFLLNEYGINKNEIYLAKAIELFGDVGSFAIKEDLSQFEYETLLTDVFDKILDEIYRFNNDITTEKYLIQFAKEIVLGWRKNKISTRYVNFYLICNLIEKNENKLNTAQKKLEEIKECYFYLINSEQENNDSEILPEFNTVDKEEELEEYIPEYEKENFEKPKDEYENNNLEKPNIDNTMITSTTSYEKINNKCYLLEIIYENGVEKNKTLKEVSKEDYVFCGMNDYIFSDNEINNIINSQIEIDRDYIESNQNEQSNKYVFYTDKKNDIIPYYYNSGILANEVDSSITYNQLKDVFYQLCVKKNTSLVISNQKSLFVLEGKPIVLNSDKNKYSKKEVESMLDSFKTVGFKIDEEINSVEKEIQMLIDKKENIVLRHGKKEYILNNIYIENSFVIASIQEIANYFGYNINLLNNKIVLKNKNSKIEIYLNSKNYRVNGEIGEFNVVTQMKEQDGWYCDLGKLIKILGYNIEWNSENLYFEVK